MSVSTSTVGVGEHIAPAGRFTEERLTSQFLAPTWPAWGLGDAGGRQASAAPWPLGYEESPAASEQWPELEQRGKG